ncbi:MAG: glycosyltransferase [Candidatus Buchananbacteria bacterium]|nr:glycosyltransferase [Candidatus Buchananbacteria bacterium]
MIKSEAKPLISVLMPVYNGQKFLKEAINSVLNQTYQNFEIIIINDASTDKTKKIASSFVKADPRIKLINHQKNKYRSGALNTGLKHASGSYISFLDADDVYLPDKLKKQLAFLEKNKNIDLVYSDFEVIDRRGQIIFRKAIIFTIDPKKILLAASKKQKVDGTPSYRLLGHNGCYQIIPSCSPLIRKKVFAKVKFDEKLVTSQDYDLWFQIIGQGFKIARLPLASYRYRHHKNQISSITNQLKRKKSSNRIIRKLINGTYFK